MFIKYNFCFNSFGILSKLIQIVYILVIVFHVIQCQLNKETSIETIGSPEPNPISVSNVSPPPPPPFTVTLQQQQLLQQQQQQQQQQQPTKQSIQSTESPVKKSDDTLKTLSRSKASVWVDTNKGNIFSTSIGSSHLENNRNAADGNGSGGQPVGRSSNMLLTLMLQPGGQQPVREVSANDLGNDGNLKQILLLLQQQQDMSELLLEKQEKVEKLNVHLQQQVKHQHLLIVELLEQIKMFLELINSPNYSGTGGAPGAVKSMSSEDKLRAKYGPTGSNDPSTSASSSANAVITAPKPKGPDEQQQQQQRPNLPIDSISPTPTPTTTTTTTTTTRTNSNNLKLRTRLAPILAISDAETKGLYKQNKFV
ncbi:signal transducer and activator of transcription A-like [Oppia nitens]|uniref:signal transducer and activator of transcription A-like n=1 Tax=Oppia nitens TaxID=1686743 RepID=UPI0023DA3726|nr:signal transducer and activator of transcription A-like [Oppia nitens]